jgi:L,D-transpeptidase catalytic domain
MSTHRGPARPRYGRIAALGTAVMVTLLSGLAGIGVLGGGNAAASTDPLARQASYHQSQAPAPTGTTPTTTQPKDDLTDQPSTGSKADRTPLGPTTSGGHSDAPAQTPVPATSGSGRRIVFSQHLQRVWLVGAHDDTVQKTYLVSGSVTDNLQPGTYSVYSRSRWATGIDDSGVMQYFVRFTQGPTGAAIGFHSIPTKNGTPLQTTAQLGTPQSHGCIRQWKPDAIAMWQFAPVGTKVVVVA